MKLVFAKNNNMIHKHKNVFTRQKKVLVCTVIGCGAPHHQRRRKKEFLREGSVGRCCARELGGVGLPP